MLCIMPPYKQTEDAAMPNQIIPIPLPEAIYQRLQQVAHATHHSIEEVVLQTIRGNLPPSLDDLSPELHDAVADLQHMSDEALWSVAKDRSHHTNGAAPSVCCGSHKRALFQRLSTKSWQSCVLQPWRRRQLGTTIQPAVLARW